MPDARPKHYHLVAEGLCIGLGAPKPKRQRKRKPSVATVLKEAAKAGLEVARYEVDADGKVSVVTGKPMTTITDTATGNEWDTVQ